MATERDPRRDPKPGDVLRAGIHTAHVLTVPDVDERFSACIDGGTGGCTLTFWREWAKDAEVLHVSD